MRAWIYARLSNDDDPEQNSLTNQLELCRGYVEQQKYELIGSSTDDNISGMTFHRPGLEELTSAVESRLIDAVIVKDLSRLGRHRTQTALFIDYLRQKQVAVLSVTEKLNTLIEQDDLVIGVRGLMNDYYARDMSKKIRAGYREKQREGIVIVPPFGYRKDKNTGEIQILPEAAETVRLVFSLYIQGHGQKEIARRLTALECKTPAQIQHERYSTEPFQRKRKKAVVWNYVSVKRILQSEVYTGVLNNHRSETHGKSVNYLPVEEWERHEGFLPAIISKEDWKAAQVLLKARARPAPGNRALHRYAGLLTCQECGEVFVPMNRYWNGGCRVEYVCKGYHRNGKDYCTSHRIHEESIDRAVWEYATSLRKKYVTELATVEQQRKEWALRKPILDAHLASLRKRASVLEQEIDEIVMEKLRG